MTQPPESMPAWILCIDLFGDAIRFFDRQAALHFDVQSGANGTQPAVQNATRVLHLKHATVR